MNTEYERFAHQDTMTQNAISNQENNDTKRNVRIKTK